MQDSSSSPSSPSCHASSISNEEDDSEYDSQEKKRLSREKYEHKHERIKPNERRRVQKFRKEYTDEFPWAQESPKSNTMCRCSVCSQDISSERTSLVRHANSDKHKKNERSVKSTGNLFVFTKQRADIEAKVKENEIKISLFVIEHDIPIAALDHLVQLIKQTDPTSQILQKISYDRIRSIVAKLQSED